MSIRCFNLYLDPLSYYSCTKGRGEIRIIFPDLHNLKILNSKFKISKCLEMVMIILRRFSMNAVHFNSCMSGTRDSTWCINKDNRCENDFRGFQEADFYYLKMTGLWDVEKSQYRHVVKHPFWVMDLWFIQRCSFKFSKLSLFHSV